MSSQEPGEEGDSGAVAPQTDEAAPPAAPEAAEVEEPVAVPDEGASTEAEYEELIVPEKVAKPRKKRKHIGAIITVVVILLILVAWTVASPKILTVEGATYVNSSVYANLGNFTGFHKSWAANTTWGISVSGDDNVSVNETFPILILVTKVKEKPSNFWFRGTAISITNMTVRDGAGVILALLGNKSDLGFGKAGTLNLKFSNPGNYSLSVTVQFLVYVDMRIGFLPVEKINLEPLELNPIVVT